MLPRLERREQVHQQRRVVEPVRVETAAVHHLPRARDDALLVRAEQREGQAVADADQTQRCRAGEDRGEGDARPAPEDVARTSLRPRGGAPPASSATFPAGTITRVHARPFELGDLVRRVRCRPRRSRAFRPGTSWSRSSACSSAPAPSSPSPASRKISGSTRSSARWSSSSSRTSTTQSRPSSSARAVQPLELPVVAFEPRERQHAGIGAGCTRLLGRALRPPEEWQRGRLVEIAELPVAGRRPRRPAPRQRARRRARRRGRRWRSRLPRRSPG